MAQTVAKTSLAALPDLGSVMGENGYLHYNEDGVDYRFPIALLSQISVLSAATGAKSIGLDLTTVWNVLSGRTRNFFEFLSDDKIISVQAGESVDVTTELQSAMAANCTIKLPDGDYFVTQAIAASVNSSLIGDGPQKCSIDNRGIDHLFYIPAGSTHGWKAWAGFKIKSSNQAALKKYAFYFTGSAASGYLQYAQSYWFQMLEFDGIGMGGGWYLQDCKYIVIRDCGAADHGNPFYITGAVYGLLVDNYQTTNTAAPTMAVGSYGVWMGAKTYTDGNGTITPNHVHITHSSFDGFTIGAKGFGNNITFSQCKFPNSLQYGGHYQGGGVEFIRCYASPASSREYNYVGFFTPAVTSGTAEKCSVWHCTVEMVQNTSVNSANYTSKGVQVSSGTTTHIGAEITGTTFKGDGYTYGVHVVNGNVVKIEGNAFQYTGVNIRVDECQSLWMVNNSCNLNTSTSVPLGTYSITTTNTAAQWTVIGNQGVFATTAIANPSRMLLVNALWTPYQTRTYWSPAFTDTTSIVAGATYTITVTTIADATAAYQLAGLLVSGLMYSIVYVSATSVRVTFYNPTANTISLSGTLRIKTEWPPVG